MFIKNINIFFGDIIFFLNEIYLINLIFFLICLNLILNKFVKSLNINKIIIELILPFFIINLFFLNYLKNLNIIFFFFFKIDNFFLFFKFLLIFFLFIFFFLSRFYFLIENIKIIEFVLLIFLSIKGSIIILLSINLINIYIGLEIQNLCFYVLTALKRFSNFSIEASLKYFLFGSFSSSLLLFSISLIYCLLGTLNIFDIFFILINFNYKIFYFLLIFSIIIFLSGIFFKLGNVPFHWWLPDIYEGIFNLIILFFSIIPKIILLYLIIKLFFFIFFFELNLSLFFFVIGLCSIIIGIINIMYQLKLKKFLAYSTIINMGFILIVLSNFNIESIFSSIFFLICYILTIISFFWIFLFYRKKNKKELINLIELKIFNFNIILSFFLCLIIFSFLGLPPFIGFFGKIFIYLDFILKYNYLFLIILLILTLFISFYYIRIIRFIYFFKFFIEKIYFININLNIFFIFFLFLNIFFIFFFDYFCEKIFIILLTTYLNIL